LFRVAVSIACLCFLTASAAVATEPPTKDTKADTEIYSVGVVFVWARRPIATAGGSSAIEVQVDSLPLPAAATVEEVFRELPLLHVRTNSRGEAEISARGSESRQVAVLVDGAPITLAWDARADVSVIPATALQEVTFTRGLSSMLYGPNVLGGILEIRLVPVPIQPDERTLQVTMGADDVGSFGSTVTTSISGEVESGVWLVRGGAGIRTTPGDPLARGIREPVYSDDALRLNTDAERVDGFVALRYRTNGGAWLSFSGSTFREERGIAAELGLTDDDARLWRYPHISRTLLVLSTGTGFRESPLGGHGELRVSAGLDRGQTEINAYGSRDYQEVTSFEGGDDLTTTLRLLANQTVGTRVDFRAAFTWADIHHDESIPDGVFEYQQRLMSVGLEGAWNVLQSHGALRTLSVSLGGAYDQAETPKTGGRPTQDPLSEVGGRFGLSAVFGEKRRTVLHAGVSRRGRFPALRELYSGALNRFVPNPDLEPEKLLTMEAGVTTGVGGSEIQVVGFHSVLEDAVVRITLNDGTGRLMRVNRDELKATGVELLLSHRFGWVDFVANATFQSVELTDTEADKTSRPEDLPEVFGDVGVRFPVVWEIIAGVGARYIGTQYAIDLRTGEDMQLPDRAVFGMSITRRWPLRISWGPGSFSALEARLAVENIGDVALYGGWGLPEPGRRVRLEVLLR
jgi:iron complex outermembrane receptor protein